MPKEQSTIQMLEGGCVFFHSKKQKEVFENHTSDDTDINKTKIVKQHSDGAIVLHKFFSVSGHWMGYVVIIGPRGGKKTYHNFNVWVKRDGSMELNVRV